MARLPAATTGGRWRSGHPAEPELHKCKPASAAPIPAGNARASVQNCRYNRPHPLQAAGKLHNIDEISTLPLTSFQGGQTYSCIAKVTSIIESKNWYYKACNRCKTGYNNISDTPRCACPFPVQSPEYKLPLTITDSSSTMEAIAFYSVAEELVECSAVQASHNMQIEPDNQPPVLNMAIGKTRLFKIGISKDFSSRYPIKYVLKKSFKVDDHEKSIMLSTTKEIQNAEGFSKTTNDAESLEGSHNYTTPVSIDMQHTQENEIRSGAKRSIDFNLHDDTKSNRSMDEINASKLDNILDENSENPLAISPKEMDSNPIKRQRQGNADDTTMSSEKLQ